MDSLLDNTVLQEMALYTATRLVRKRQITREDRSEIHLTSTTEADSGFT